MNYFLYTKEGPETKLFNKISSTANQCVYPDIIIDHDFSETGIVDDVLFDTALRAISDYGSSRVLFAEVACNEDKIFLENALRHIFSDEAPSDNSLCEKMIDNLQLSETMSRNFRQLITYYTETGNDVRDLLAPFFDEYPLPVRSKDEGKKIYELIRNKVLG